MKKEITCYLHSDKADMYQVGEDNGLTGEALNDFMYALYEVEVTMNVDMETGEYEITKFNES